MAEQIISKKETVTTKRIYSTDEKLPSDVKTTFEVEITIHDKRVSLIDIVMVKQYSASSTSEKNFRVDDFSYVVALRDLLNEVLKGEGRE